jgi:hypothetical protein
VVYFLMLPFFMGGLARPGNLGGPPNAFLTAMMAVELALAAAIRIYAVPGLRCDWRLTKRRMSFFLSGNSMLLRLSI